VAPDHGDNFETSSVFNSSMKNVALIALSAFVVAVLHVFKIYMREPVRPAASSTPQSVIVPIGRVTGADFESRLLEKVARAEAARETDAVWLGRAEVIPDPSRNAPPKSWNNSRR
jgi:hypothetical protein